MPTEKRTFIGDMTGQAFDGWAGFRKDTTYQLTYTKEFDEVRIVLDHL